MTVTLKIESAHGPSVELGKRTYFPGASLHTACPNCHEPRVIDLGNEYLEQYMRSGVAFEIHLYCHDCEHEWTDTSVMFQVDVTVKLVPYVEPSSEEDHEEEYDYDCDDDSEE